MRDFKLNSSANSLVTDGRNNYEVAHVYDTELI